MYQESNGMDLLVSFIGNSLIVKNRLIPCRRIFDSFWIGLLLSTLLLVNFGGCGIRENTPPKVKLKLVAEGFTSPVALTFPADGPYRLFVVDQSGLIWIIS